MRNKLYDKHTQSIIRGIAITCALFLSIIQAVSISKTSIFSDFYQFLKFSENSVVILLSIFLSLYPHKLGFMSIASFLYAISCTVFEVDNTMGVFMYFLGISTLYVRGFFIRKKRLKISFFTIIYILMLLSEVRFNLNDLYKGIMLKLGYSIVYATSVFLISSYLYNTENSITKILNLANFPGLNSNDIPMLQKVLENKQYKEIGMDLSRSEGTIRNRLNKIYDTLGVMDRIGFITTYTGYKIVYEEKSTVTEVFSSIKKKK